jgi:hypothetical protein
MGLSMKSLKRASREEQLMRVLIVVELLSLLHDGLVDGEEQYDVFGTIYSITHGVLGHCNACGDKWTTLLEKLEVELQPHGDSKRILSKCKSIGPKFIPLYLRG